MDVNHCPTLLLGWSGVECEAAECPQECLSSSGSTGACRDDGFCECLTGFTGTTCDVRLNFEHECFISMFI